AECLVGNAAQIAIWCVSGVVENACYSSRMMMNACEFDLHLRGLRGNERATEVDTLLALVEFDRREVYLELGYDKLWTYLMKVLHYCEGATYRRCHAVKILQRFPRLTEQLRDGRLNLTTLVELEPVLRDETVDTVTTQA